MVGGLNLPFVRALYRQFKKALPLRRSMAAMIGYEEPLTTEEAIAQGAMSLEEFAHHALKTGGKIDNLAPPPG